MSEREKLISVVVCAGCGEVSTDLSLVRCTECGEILGETRMTEDELLDSWEPAH